jgi:hypothetical protein
MNVAQASCLCLDLFFTVAAGKNALYGKYIDIIAFRVKIKPFSY